MHYGLDVNLTIFYFPSSSGVGITSFPFDHGMEQTMVCKQALVFPRLPVYTPLTNKICKA